jgi:MFS family permease
MATFGTSSVLGPVIGGFFAAQSSLLGVSGWRWVFLVNVPIGIAALVVVSRTLHLHHERREARIDWWGASLLIVALVPLLTVAEQGRVWGWDSGRAITGFVVGAIGIIGFIDAERRMGDDALIPLRLFKIRAASVTIAASVIVGMAMFGGMMILPLYMQIVHAASPMKSGFLMLPMVLGMMTGSIISGQITSRTGLIRIFPRIGSGLAAVALLLLSTIDADTHLWVVMAIMLLLGYGLGNCMQPLTVIVQNAVPPREIGVATSSATFFRQIGGTIGVAVFLSVLFSTVGGNIASSFQTESRTAAFQAAAADPQVLANPVNREVVEGLSGHAQGGGIFASVQDDSSVLEKMADVFAHPFKAGFAESMSTVFFWAGLIGIIAFLILMLMPPVELRTQSAGAAARAEAMAPTAPVDDEL